MDTIINAIITPLVECLIAPVKKHWGFLVSSEEFVEDMKTKMAKLNLTEKDIRDNWNEAVEKDHKVSHHVPEWLTEVEKMNEKVQNIPTSGIGCFNMVKRYKAGKQSYNILMRVQKVEEWKSDIVFARIQKPLAEVVSTATGPSTFDGTQNNFESRDLIYKAALKALESNNESQKMIALCGMGGVGKTTMIEQLEKDVKTFDRVVKVVLGENVDPVAVQRAIAIYIDKEDLKEETKDARAKSLGKTFENMSKQGKKTLVIMDDLWSKVDLKDFGLSPLPNGFKVMFTSRDEYLCTYVGVKIDSIFKVGLLNDVDAKNLFFGIVGLSNGDDLALQKIGEDIVEKCGGLPVAIATIANSLSGNIVEAWDKALRRLQKDDLKDLESITHRVFEISYENLKEDSDRAIFLLSGLFPDDFNIRTEDLLRFGWGLGFFKDAKTLTTARSDIKICVNNLIRANLLTESDHMGCVKMHDLIRAFVLHKVTEIKQASIINYDNKSEQDAKETYDRILLKCTGMIKFPVEFNHPNLSMLMLMDSYGLLKFPGDIYERMEKLEVVSYENMRIPPVLLAFEHPTKLRSLCLRSCRFINDDISLLGSLRNLETLSFIDCEIRRLPSAIGELKKLKLLDLTGCVHLCVDDGVFKGLVSLEELYMRANKDSPINFTKANYDELEILSQQLLALELEFYKNEAQPKNVSFKNLERFRVSIGTRLMKLKDGKKNFFKNTIQLVGDCSEILDCNIGNLFSKTYELHLQVNEMSRLEDVSKHHSFSNLTILHVSSCADLTCLFTVDVVNGLKKLERLIVSQCPVMRTLVAENSRTTVIKFQKLNFMSLISLPKLVNFWDNVIDFSEMAELVLDDLPNFTSIYPHTHNTSEMQSLFDTKAVIPRLETLDISRMENLKHIWSCETVDTSNDSMLRKIIVRNCDNLVNLFPNNPFPLLKHLEELVVDKCNSVEVLFNLEFENVCKTWKDDSSNLRSIRVDNSEKLKELCRMKGVNKGDIHIKCFKDVESIMIKSCVVFKNIFTPVTTSFDLGALANYITDGIGKKNNAILKEEISEINELPNVTYPSYLLHALNHLRRLEIENDDRVEQVFVMDSHQPLLLAHLEVLNLIKMNEMCHVWNWSKFLTPQHQHLQYPFQNLTDIYLYYCPKIKYLFSPPMARYLSNLKSVCIRWCDGVEEVISKRNDRNEVTTLATSSHKNSTLFPHLDIIKLIHLPCLKSIDGDDQTIHDQSQSGQVVDTCWSLCQYPTKISIDMCDALPVLIPWYALGQMKKLQELDIGYCATMKEVFESEHGTNNVDAGSGQGGAGTTLTSPTLFPSRPTVVVQLSNLKYVSIYKCSLLSHVFTFSALESLEQLKELRVKECNAIQVIVKEENGAPSANHVAFPKLETLELLDLPNLKGFFLGSNEVRWRLLDNVMIDNCPQLMMFTRGESKTPKLKYIHTRLGKHSVADQSGLNFRGAISEYQYKRGYHGFEIGLNFHGMTDEYQNTSPRSSTSDPNISEGLPCSFRNLIEINIQHTHGDIGPPLIPSSVLLQLQKLEKIIVNSCYKGEEVFEILEREWWRFHKSQTVVKIPNLTQVNLEALDNVKYLWKSNRLLVLEFPNLTSVYIDYCKSLKHVFTCSMVGSLLQLQDLHISYCKNIEVIVKEEDEKEGDVKVNEIMLPRLRSLKLRSLKRLKGFCLGEEAFSWPSLDTLQIKRCPEINVFTKGCLSTLELKVIDTMFGMCHVTTDLNSFIKTKQEEGYEF